MGEQDDGGAAFPLLSHGGVHEHQFVNVGMSLREYFAAAALTGLLAEPRDAGTQPWSELSEDSGLAGRAYQMADAMLSARASETGGDRG